jgi:hypothetical protein
VVRRFGKKGFGGVQNLSFGGLARKNLEEYKIIVVYSEL